MSEQNENVVILDEPLKRGDTEISQLDIIMRNA